MAFGFITNTLKDIGNVAWQGSTFIPKKIGGLYGGAYSAGDDLEDAGAAEEARRIDQAEEASRRIIAAGHAQQSAANRAASAAEAQARLFEQAAIRAKEIANKNADLVEAEGEEEVRRAVNVNKATMSTTRARQAASGVRFDSTTAERFRTDLAKENRRTVNWMVDAWQQREDVVREGGDIESLTLTAEAQGLRSGAAQMAASGAEAFAQAQFDANKGIQDARGSGRDITNAGRDQKHGVLSGLISDVGNVVESIFSFL